MKRHRERYAHCFSKNRVIQFVNGGSHRGSQAAKIPKDGSPANGVVVRSNPCRVQTESLGRVVTPNRASPILGEVVGRDPEDRRQRLPACPTVERLYKGHAGLAVVCAACHHAVIHPNPSLPDYFKRHWRRTLLDLERRCRCANCGSRNARLYPWWSEGGVTGPPR